MIHHAACRRRRIGPNALVAALLIAAVASGGCAERSVTDRIIDAKVVYNATAKIILAADANKLIPAEAKPAIKSLDNEIYSGFKVADAAVAAAGTQSTDDAKQAYLDKAKQYIELAESALERFKGYAATTQGKTK